MSLVPAVGTKLRCLGAEQHATEMWDTTVLKEYVIEGHDEDGDPYYIDDAGEQNFSAAPGGQLRFVIVY
jgi:hypothetical protein